jgi:hypothetical protein
MGKRGPKPSGNARKVFYRRVDPAIVNLLDEVIRSGGKVLVNYVVPLDKACEKAVEPEKANGDVKMLLDDIERLEREKTALGERLDRVSRMGDDEKLAIWIRKYDQLLASIRARYPDF